MHCCDVQCCALFCSGVRIGKCCLGLCNDVHEVAVLCCDVQCCAVLCSKWFVIQCCAVQCFPSFAILCIVFQCCTVLCSNVQCCTVLNRVVQGFSVFCKALQCCRVMQSHVKQLHPPVAVFVVSALVCVSHIWKRNKTS